MIRLLYLPVGRYISFRLNNLIYTEDILDIESYLPTEFLEKDKLFNKELIIKYVNDNYNDSFMRRNEIIGGCKILVEHVEVIYD